MSTVAVVQARTGSSRFPGKVLAELEGAPLLTQELRRLRRARMLDEIVVATTTSEGDDAVVELAEREGVRWYRGSETDVLGRYVAAAREAGAESVVRVTADCPLLDPEVVDLVVARLHESEAELDYASNVVERSFPQGLDVEAFFVDVLERLNRLASSPSAREHVTWYLRFEHPELFLVGSVDAEDDDSDLRWTVDTPSDLELVRRLYRDLRLADMPYAYREIVAYVRSQADLVPDAAVS
jgi:spore coat polysaccharide biosynthesis protein SpsF